MNIYIPLAILLILLALFVRKDVKASKIVFAITMMASMIFAALRFEFGPDYFQYNMMYDRLQDIGVEGYLAANEHIEVLFLYFLNAFPSYYLFIAVQSVLWFGTLYFFLKKRYDHSYLWILVFLLYFDVNNILNNYVAIRTSFVGILFLIAVPFLRGKKIIYILLIVLAFFLHNSSAPLILFALFNGNKKDNASYNELYVTLITLGVISFLFGDVISGPITEYLIDLFPAAFGKYSYYMENVFTTRSLSLGNFVFLAIRVFIVIILIGGLRKETDCEYVLFYKIAILMSMIAILFGNMLTSRLNMNVAPLLIAVYLRTIKYLRKDVAVAFVACLMAASLFSFYNVLHTESAITFLEYHSILER